MMLDKTDKAALANLLVGATLLCAAALLCALLLGVAIHLCLSLANWGVLWA